MIRLVLLAVLLLVAVAALREWSGAGGRRREERLRELRGAFLHGRYPAQPHLPAAVTQHSCGGLTFQLPAPWRPEQHGDVLTFRIGAGGDAALRVLRRGEEGPADSGSSSSELLPDGSALVRWLTELQDPERVQYGWRLRSASDAEAVTFLFELTPGEAGEAFRQADVTTIERAVREARFCG